jgi:AcrR family transcriptional regulator
VVVDSGPTTLRSAKRQRTHEAIADAAAALFAAHGFDAVTVDDVARAADVGRQTIFNHFAVKEDLVFDEAVKRRESLLAAVTGRPTGTTPLTAVHEWTLAAWQTVRTIELGGRPDSGIFALVRQSSALQARGRELAALTAAALVDVLEIDTWTTAHVVATALVAVDQAMFTAMARHVAEGRRIEDVRAAVIADGARAFEVLERGLGTWPS